jgi:hypothetical protein
MPVSPPDAYQGGPVRAQGMAADANGNIWISSFGNNSVYVFKHGNPQQAVYFDQEFGGGPFDIAVAADGSAWVSNGLGLPPATIAKYALVNGQVVKRFRHSLGDQLRGLSLDSHGNAWLASQGDQANFVYAVRPDGTEIGHFNGGGIDHAWEITVDGEDNIWVGNFGSLDPGNTFTGRITKLWGINAPPGHNVGDPISPETGYTVPTAGSQVLLHHGQPLYGPPPAPPCFIPAMRCTDVNIDQAGNLWSINNWKPDIDTDFAGNPGGDGVVIFVGLAPPPTTQVH